MAIISLRAYNREIEGMIDNVQLDEAVAHCRHILTTFPKHIATYRLLGKAHLEQQRISDATDIFQRVLSALPDDFISNVGMSIIREDENNLDAAIWHMEMAYEAQPANIAIQDELRRLYGRRDGMQPPRVRLTRGALARMYAKGGLYDQAIGELRAAISEDPNRVDLQLLLAQMFFQTDQRVEAVDTCMNILKKMPICLEANRILAISLPETEGSDVVKNARQIVISMDPYYAFTEPEAISSEQVSENAVNIERLEYKSGIQVGEAPSQPSWATSLGISMQKPAEENLPDWLKSAEAPEPTPPEGKTTPSISPFIWDTQEVEKIITDTSKPEGEIPDWMKDAGWKPATGEAVQPPAEAAKTDDLNANVPVNEDLEKADIPEWLRGIAPEDFIGSETQPIKEDELTTPWLEPHQPGPTDSIIQWLDEKKPEGAVNPPGTAENIAATPEEEMPDWLKDLDVTPSKATQMEKPAETTSIPTPVPSAFIEEPIIPETPLAEAPATEPSVELAGEVSTGAPETTPPAELPSQEKPLAPTEEHGLDWLKDIAVAATAAGVAATAVEKSKAEAPTVEEPVVATELPATQESHPPEAIPPAAEGIIPQEQPQPAEAQPETQAPAVAGAFLAAEMLSKPEQAPGGEQTAAPGETLTAVPAPIPEEIAPTEVSPMPVESPSIPAEQPLPAEAPMMSDAETYSWLESLAAEQETKTGELGVPAIRSEAQPPEWVKLEAEPITEETLPAESQAGTEAPALPAEEIPDWIKGLGEESEAAPVPAEPVSAEPPATGEAKLDELPAWLQEMEPTETEATAQPEEDLEWKSEGLPAWLKQITESEEAEATAKVETPPEHGIPVAPVVAGAVIAEELASPAQAQEKVVEEPLPETAPMTVPREEPEQPAPPAPTEVEPVAAEEIEKPRIAAAEVVTPEPIPQAEAPVEVMPQTTESILSYARDALNQGQDSQALELYHDLIKQNSHVDEIIKDLQGALHHNPANTDMWVTLGDAHSKTKDLQEALNAYSKAEELVR